MGLLSRPSSDMGSEHYCLRWNNHQSNLLGVFSQLLRDESLVDVTLACSEGHSIRAHRVVLSACSSYFQTLFVDHPSRHPIVILKDVRFSELRTLIEFMYKGEVNVEYCQLSALLKTAESLKVKGLAEMTNLSSAASHEHERDVIEREQQQEQRERDHSEPQPQQPQQQILHNRLHDIVRSDVHRGDHRERERDRAERERDRAERERDRAERAAEREREHREREHVSKQSSSSTSTSVPVVAPDSMDQLSHRLSEECVSSSPPQALTCVSPLPSHSRTLGGIARGPPPPPSALSEPMTDEGGGGEEDISGSVGPLRASDSPESLRIGVGNAGGASASVLPSGSGGSGSVDGASVACVERPNDMTISNSNSTVLTSCGGSGGSSRQTIGPGSSSSVLAPGGPLSGSVSTRLSPPHKSEPIAGPSGLPPVQQVPLSLKKEVDWGGMADDKSTGESSSDYRHSYDPEMLNMEGAAVAAFPCMYCGATFPHQSKLTRHILSHSLETLKYREQLHQHMQGLAPPTLGIPDPASPFAARISMHEHGPGAGGGSAGGGPGVSAASMSAEALAAAEHAAAAMELELAEAAAAAGGGASSALGIGGAGSVVLCKFCGKSFPDVGSLIAHLPAHTGDRPFKCEFCGKAFKLRHHMKDHCRVHTGERPFRCALCGKTFSRSTILKAHEKTHFPKYVRKFLSPSPLDTEEESSPHQ